MSEDMIYRMVGGLGFPIVVAVYHMIYQERTLRKLTEAIQSLREAYINGSKKYIKTEV